MLHTLKIKNFALIYDQTINFTNNFNVLVGETGAGKSLILDALSFVLGDKANKMNIRFGEDKLSVQAVFDNNKNTLAFLEENNIDSDDFLIISRSLSQDGKSIATINGSIVTTSLLKQVAIKLIDSYAQNENIELLNVKNHLSILDSYSGQEVEKLKNEIATYLTRLNALNSQMEQLGGDSKNRDRELELLNYQIADIENANLVIGEDEEIQNKINKLSNIEKVFENLRLANSNLSYIEEKISECQHFITLAEKYDPSLNNILERINSAKIEIKDIKDSIDFDEGEYDINEIDSLNKRLEDIKSLKKKYGNTIEDILDYLSKIKENYDNLLFGEEKLNKLNKEKTEIIKQLYTVCVNLSNERKKFAKMVEELVISELKFLGFNNCNFKIQFNEMPALESATFTHKGLDEVEFLFSANAGENLKSLAKTISGGEMSRFMLALKNIFAGAFETSTLVFDEIDTGISGEIGQKVAERLAMLSKKYQLICITHLCQVSAMADNYIYVAKEVADNKTYTKTKILNNKEIIDYIAVASGAEPTEVAIKFATELKERAESFKKNIN